MAFVVPIVLVGGSSPLTRGKPPPGQRRPHGRGLIPAHAGKTRKRTRPHRRPRAHPRSRGENQDENIINLSKQGSSPLTRGKLARAERRRGGERLIPAHAGKTEATALVSEANTAHPRSRGENDFLRAIFRAHPGSSPLTRGKPLCRVRDTRSVGLIPAHAGKTGPPARSPPGSGANPRSRGENPARV